MWGTLPLLSGVHSVRWDAQNGLIHMELVDDSKPSEIGVPNKVKSEKVSKNSGSDRLRMVGAGSERKQGH